MLCRRMFVPRKEQVSMNNANIRYRCTVCGFGGLLVPPEDYTICPCCSTHFSNDDYFRTVEELRTEWISNGMIWWSKSTTKPIDYDPYKQLESLGISIELHEFCVVDNIFPFYDPQDALNFAMIMLYNKYVDTKYEDKVYLTFSYTRNSSTIYVSQGGTTYEISIYNVVNVNRMLVNTYEYENPFGIT